MFDAVVRCGSGHCARSSCATRKDHVDPVRESDSDVPLSHSRRRPRGVTAQSESDLIIFAHGHRKPANGHNTTAHKCGRSDLVPRTIQGTTLIGLVNRSVDSLLHMSTTDALHSDSLIKDSTVRTRQEQRMAKSEHSSPAQCPRTNLEQLNDFLQPVDLSHAPRDYDFMQNMDGFTSVAPLEQPLFSTYLNSAAIDWFHYDDLGLYNNPGSCALSSASGEMPEVECFGSMNDIGAARPYLLNNKSGSDIDTSEFGGKEDAYRLSTASSRVGVSHGQMLVCYSAENLDLDAFLEGATTPSEHEAAKNSWVPAPAFVDESKSTQTPSNFDDTIPSSPLFTEEEGRIFLDNQPST